MKQKTFTLRHLTFTVIGMMTATVAMANTAESEPTVDLGHEVITIDRQGTKVKTNVVTSAIKDKSTETDLRGLFKNEPSISIGGGNGTSQYFYIRGMGQNSVDVKVDNAYSDSQIHYHQGRHMLDPALVKIVSVQKGAGSASAGIGQTNGAVIAKTLDATELLKNSTNENFGVKVNAGYNSNDGYNYGVAAFGQHDKFDFLAAVNGVNEDDYKGGDGFKNGKDGSKRVPYSALDKLSYLVKAGVTLDNHRFVLSHMHEQHKGERSIREEFDYFDRQVPADRKMSVSNTNLEWTGNNLGFAQEATANIYRLVHGRWSAEDKSNGYAVGRGNPSNIQGSLETEVVTTGANVNFDSAVSQDLLVKYGVNYRNQHINPAFKIANVVDQEKTDAGLYVEGIRSLTDQITLTGGVRYDHFDFKAMDGKTRSDGAINPSFGIIYEPTANLSLSASHNYATRSPRLHDAIMSHGHRGIVTIGDDTKAEQARSTEVGFNYDNGVVSVDGSYFWQNIKDALGTTNGRSNHGTAAQTIVNAGKIKNQGYELSVGARHEGFSARLGVADNKPRFHTQTRFDGTKEIAMLSGNPEYASAIGRTWTASLGYRFEEPRVEIGVHHRLVEDVKAEDNYFLTGGTLKTGATQGKDGYNVTDLSVNWKPRDDNRLNVNFAINNIANKLYTPHAQRGTLPGAGREFRVGVNFTY